ncbi:transglutaminase-like putative cysteine protease [Marmoricola sp. OAE513]|uniref:transglutaminase family protein n=1 Tax=Marmoricola sp. OAE513 TaxID=2817894 RepID=UPI001AE567E0
MKFRVWHRTTYTYDEPVTDSLGVGHLTPRALPWQNVASPTVTIEPVPADLTHEVDYYGNSTTYFQVTQPHTELRVTASAEVESLTPFYDDHALAQPWEDAVPTRRRDAPEAWRAVDFALESSQVAHTERARAYAAQSLTPGRPVGEAVTDLVHRIHVDFAYEVGATTVTSTVDEVFDKRAGVCQDFAHLTIACLRTHGLAARYVSGYLATEPPPGRERIVGADASHAWVSVWVPGTENWLAVDPTNDQWVNDRYITAAWGRDYGDVPPLKGVIFSDATTSTLTVEVDVAPLP